MADDVLRSALASLTHAERAALIARWDRNASDWSRVNEPLSDVWASMRDLAVDVDRTQATATVSRRSADRPDRGHGDTG